MEQPLPPSPLAGRHLSIDIQVFPIMISAGKNENASLYLRLYDEKTNNTIRFTTYSIKLVSLSSSSNRTLLNDYFSSPSGPLNLTFSNAAESPDHNCTNPKIDASQSPFLPSWEGDPNGSITVQHCPLTDNPGLYLLDIKIFGMDNERTIFSDQNAPRFEKKFTIAVQYPEQLRSEEQTYTALFDSYYNPVQNVTYDSSKQTISWSVPFNWSKVYNHEILDNLYIRQVVAMPKEIVPFNPSHYQINGTANGFYLSSMTTFVPTSFSGYITYDMAVYKPNLFAIANTTNLRDSKVLTFMLTSNAKPDQVWNTAYAVGQFKNTNKSDQIFMFYYKAINGTIQSIHAGQDYFGANITSSNTGSFELMYPRNFPFDNSYSPEFAVLVGKPGQNLTDILPNSTTTECFYDFHVPIQGNTSIQISPAIIPEKGFPFHGDNVSSSCIPDTIVQGIPNKLDGTITPYQQYKAGVAANDIACPASQQLIVQPKTGQPYCIYHSSYDRLSKWWNIP